MATILANSFAKKDGRARSFLLLLRPNLITALVASIGFMPVFGPLFISTFLKLVMQPVLFERVMNNTSIRYSEDVTYTYKANH